MKRKMCRFVTIFWLSVFFFSLTTPAYASVTEGRALLFNDGNPTYSKLLEANAKFEAAVTANPSDQEANLFYAVTRLAALLDNNVTYTADAPIENVKELLDGFGMDAAGRDLFNWTASIPEDIYGNIILPSDSPSGTDVQTFLQSVIIPEIDGAIANLNNITSETFINGITLLTTETGELNDIEVDYGDVLLYKSLLYAAKALILIIDSYDLNADIDAIVAKINDDIFNVNNDLLDAYPNLLTLLTGGVGATKIGEAKPAVLAATDWYNDASTFIRNEADDQTDDLFSIDPEDLTDETDFRSYLADIKYSITNQQPVDMDDEEDVVRVDFSEFFDDPISIRDYLPAFIHDPYIDEILIKGMSSFPDRTFSGIFPNGLPPEEYDAYIDRVAIWGGNSDGGPFSVVFCWVNGLAPWDIESLTVYGPDGLRYDFDVEQDIRAHYRFGTLYKYSISETLPCGWYDFVLKDRDGKDYHADKHFTHNLIDVVDMSTGISPAGSAYVNTTTPTLSWASVTDETIGTLYYRVNIMDWNKEVTIYTSDRLPDATVTVPEGVLEPDTAYKWQVQVFDSQSGISPNNLSSSSWKGFSTGASAEPLAMGAFVRSRIFPDEDKTQFRIKIKGPAPWDVGSMTVTGPEGFSSTFTGYDLWQDGAYYHSESGILPNGTYTFTVVDGRDGSNLTVDKTFTFNRLPIPEYIFSPRYHGYMETTTPTFSWSPVTDETAVPVYYRILIFDYSGKLIYKSERSTATTATVPADILKVNNPYKWRVDVSDKETDPENRSTSSKRPFYVSKDNPVGSVSGQIEPASSGYISGGTIYVAAYDSPFPGGSLVSYGGPLSHAGQYALYNLPVGAELYVYARWDADSDGSGSRTPGDWVGAYSVNPITLAEGTNLTNIDVQLNIELQAASVSGNILCDDFESGHGDIYISAYDGDDPSSDRLLDSTTITDINATYTLSNLAADGHVYLFASWDKDGSGASSPADYTGSYAGNPLLVQTNGNTGINITVINELAAAIGNGLQWLSQNQNPDGSWGDQYALAKTALAVLNLEKHALSCGLSPLDTSYTYHTAVENGLNYIFANAYTTAIGSQPAGNPDGDGNGIGVYFTAPDEWHSIYYTSIVAMAIASSNAPGISVNVPGSPVHGRTYTQVLQDAVDYLAWAQTDSGYGRGGWNYQPTNNDNTRSDQSNSGWVTLALAYAEADPPDGFGLTIPGFVRTELNYWIDYSQDDVDGDDADGGSHYSDITDPNDMGANILRTGNLLQQMAFVGDTKTTERVQDAIDYIVRHWNSGWNWNPSCYHTTYTAMKGLEALGISQIDSIDWFYDFSEALKSEQNADGPWPVSSFDSGDRMLSTNWALLTLQKAVAPTEEKPDLEVTQVSEEWVNEGAGTYTVSYTVKNRGNIETLAGHDVGLTVDNVAIEQKAVPIALPPGETYSSSFTTVTLSGERDEVTVCADINGEIDELNEDNNCTANNWPPIVIGDVNDDGNVNLTDAILALQVTVGMNPAGIRSNYATSGADVNGDAKIGLAEVIYILQDVAGLR
ncbi:MAG: hypothetical protein SRB1_02534 [Desulfobacteraceae bacterium Eth-SRB1]|nr:MAG: hypothetical protein SRB1_02534 [Desulfobacteraceae bacterium Eth-SRB1]